MLLRQVNATTTSIQGNNIDKSHIFSKADSFPYVVPVAAQMSRTLIEVKVFEFYLSPNFDSHKMVL